MLYFTGLYSDMQGVSLYLIIKTIKTSPINLVEKPCRQRKVPNSQINEDLNGVKYDANLPSSDLIPQLQVRFESCRCASAQWFIIYILHFRNKILIIMYL